MTRSEIFRNNYKYQAEESKKEQMNSNQNNKKKIGTIGFVSNNSGTKFKDLLIQKVEREGIGSEER